MPFLDLFNGIEDEEQRQRNSIFDNENQSKVHEALLRELGITPSPLQPTESDYEPINIPETTQPQQEVQPEHRGVFERLFEPQRSDFDELEEGVTDVAKNVAQTGYDFLDDFQKFTEDPFGKDPMKEQTDMSNFVNRIVKGIPENASSLAKSYFTVSDYLMDLQEFEPMGTNQLGRAMNETVIKQFDVMLDEALPTKDPDAFYSALGSGIGSGLFFLAGGLAGQGLGASAGVVSSMLGAGTMSQQMFEEAIQSGASESDAFVNFLGGAGLGATEGLLGVGKILDNIGKRTGQSFIRQTLTGSVEETFQEGVQQLGQNFTAKETYDVTRSLADGLGTSMGVAFITGGLFTASSVAVERLLKDPNTTPEDRMKLEKAKDNLAEVNMKYTVQNPEGKSLHQQAVEYSVGLKEAKKNNPEMYWTVDEVSTEDALNKGIIVEVDGGAGIVMEDGDMKGLYKKVGSQEKNVAGRMLQKAVELGGIKGDNFDGYLTEIYKKNGMRVTSRTKFNEEFAPEGWNENKHGRPDIVAFVYDPNNELDIEEKTFDTYDEMIAYRDEYVKKLPAEESILNHVENKRRQHQQEVIEKQNSIPVENQVHVFHYAPSKEDVVVTPIDKAEKFFINPVKALENKTEVEGYNLYTGVIDKNKIYDAHNNPKKLGFDSFGKVSMESVIEGAKAEGYDAISFMQNGEEHIRAFNPVAVQKKPNLTLGDVVMGKWDARVSESKRRLKSGMYMRQANDFTSLPAMATSFVSDMAIVVADRMMKAKMPTGTVAGFTRWLLDEYEAEFPIIRRYARDIYELVSGKDGLRQKFNKQPITNEQAEQVMEVVKHNIAKGVRDEFMPVGNGVIVLGGDMLDFEGGRRRHVGIAYPADQAEMARAPEVKVTKRPPTRGAEGELVSFDQEGVGNLTALEQEDVLQVKGTSIKDEKQGSGYGKRLYKNAINYAISQGKSEMVSDHSLSEGAVRMYESLKKDGLNVTRADNVIERKQKTQTGIKTFYGTKDGSPVYRINLVDQHQFRLPVEGSYSIWATDAGVARQIEKSANQGNDTIVFMAYPNAWNAIFSNYDFQKQLHAELVSILGEENVPALTTEEEWTGRGSRIGVHPSSTKSKATWLQYEKDIKQAIAKAKKLKGKEEFNAEAIAMRYAVENGINLKGKIIGVAKFRQVNRPKSTTQADQGNKKLRDERLEIHRQYDTEIEGYNYVSLEQPIDYNVLKTETEGTDVAMEGTIPSIKNEEARETGRRMQLFRIIQQRGLTLKPEHTDIVNALLDLSNGDNTAINKWVSEHPEFVGEIPDPVQHEKWLKDNEKKSEQFRMEADKQLANFIAPMSAMGFLNPQVWKGLSVIGKAVARSAKTFGKWSSKMIETAGEWIRPILRSLWSQVTQLPSSIFRKASKQEIRFATENKEEERRTQQRANMKAEEPKIGKVPSETSGYNMGLEHPKLGAILRPTVEALRKEFDVRRRGTIDNEELMERARKIAERITDDDILGLEAGDVRRAEDVLAMRIYVTDRLLKVSDEIRKNATSKDGVMIKDLSNSLLKALRLWENVRALGTEAGRVVQSFGIPMDDDILEGLRFMVDMMNQLDPDGKYGGDIIAGMLEELTEDKKTKPQSKWLKRWEVGRFLFLNWILQNPLTDVANIHGNAWNLSYHIFANIGNLGGIKTLARGVGKGFKEGIKDAGEVLRGEREAISKFTEGNQVKLPDAKRMKALNYAKLFVPTTRLGMEDAFFRAMARNVETERMIKKTSKKLNVHPDEVANAVSDILNDEKMIKYTRKDYVELVKYLERIEDQLVFQQELGRFGKAMASASKVVYPIMPFVTTPANILKAGIGATPLGLASLGKSDITQEERNQIVRKALAGSVVMSSLGVFISQGLIEITGSGTDDEYERDLMEKMGYKPNHIYFNTPWGKFGGGYMNVNPFNTMLTVLGDFMDKQRFSKFDKPDSQKKWWDKAIADATTTLLAIGTSVSEQSFLQGVKGFMDFLSGRRPDWALRMFTNFARVGAIQGVQRITGTEDRGRYDTKGKALDQLQKNFPLASNEGLTESVSRFGEQRQSQYERFPIPFSEIPEDTPQYQFLIDHGLKVGQPSKTTKLGNNVMNEKQLEFFRKGVGQLMDRAIEKLYLSQQPKEGQEDFTPLNDEELQDRLDKAYTLAKEKVKKVMKDRIIQQYQLLNKD